MTFVGSLMTLSLLRVLTSAPERPKLRKRRVILTTSAIYLFITIISYGAMYNGRLTQFEAVVFVILTPILVLGATFNYLTVPKIKKAPAGAFE